MGGSGAVQAGAAPGLYLVEENVDVAFERAVAAGADVVYGPEETEWGPSARSSATSTATSGASAAYQPGSGW
jgi:predicted enzyme related to lactoylglutathione lyase